MPSIHDYNERYEERLESQSNARKSKIKVDLKKDYRFQFTFNNYTQEDEKKLKDCKDLTFLIYGYEIGPESGTPHLQGYLEIEKGARFKEINELFPGIASKVAFASADANKGYCSKSETKDPNKKEIFSRGTVKKKLSDANHTPPTHGGSRNGAGRPIGIQNNYFGSSKKDDSEEIEKFRKELIDKVIKRDYNVDLHLWQEAILQIIADVPDPRKIYWIFEQKGNRGKSFIAKLIACTVKGTIVCNGKKSDIFNQVNTLIENLIEPKVIICDISRQNQNKIDMTTIETLKTGLLYSGKYKGGICAFERPHIFIFSNFAPDTENISEDMWEIIDLDEEYE